MLMERIILFFSILFLVIPFSYGISVTCGSSNVCSGEVCSCRVSDCELGYLDIYSGQTEIKPIQEFEIALGLEEYVLSSFVMPKSNSVYYYKLSCTNTGQNFPSTPTRGRFTINVGGGGDCIDGTAEGGCTDNRPDRCVDGDVVKDCEFCGCISGQVCDEVSGACKTSCGGGGGYCGDRRCDEGESCPRDCGLGGEEVIEENKGGKINFVLILIIALVVLLILFAFRKKFKRVGRGAEEGGRVAYTPYAPMPAAAKEDEHKRKLSEALKKAAENIRKQHAGHEGEYKYPYGKDKEGKSNFEDTKRFI